MKRLNALAACALAALLAGMTPQTLAGDGHDHGDAPAPVAGPTLPRFSAESELFELVGVVDGRAITLYLDRYADNSPVEGATLELEIDGIAVPVEAHGVGEFEVMLQQELPPGVVSVTAIVTAGDEIDLLAAEIDIHADESAHDTQAAPAWAAYTPWLGAGGLALGLIGWATWRRGPARSKVAGGAA